MTNKRLLTTNPYWARLVPKQAVTARGAFSALSVCATRETSGAAAQDPILSASERADAATDGAFRAGARVRDRSKDVAAQLSEATERMSAHSREGDSTDGLRPAA
ncbi:hypothetical protein KO516_12325 [Citreicella sp. C3M06]|uniref:hypothetical protein n=1 Tax=Citreicella sp. C3M06 TaxID=2841564 RepID=UPI001C0919E6|nr:hypothetical protein [Citreicella sp. C3M06]MBU2961591.1 hypothetical protein [Citreicella sp. C3M06]